MGKFKLCLYISVALTLAIRAAAGDETPGALTSWGRIVDPDQDCVFQTGDDSLSIRFGTGAHGLDVEVDRMNAPRVLRSFDGDCSVQVTVDGNLPLPDPSLKVAREYISGGLLVMQDNRNYIRLERASFTRNGQIWHYANFEQRIDGKRKRMGQFNDFPLPPDGPIQLRLEVLDDQVRGLARSGNDDWHLVGTAEFANRTTLLAGVSGVKTFQEEATIHFRELRYSGDGPTIATDSSTEIEMAASKIDTTTSNNPITDLSPYFELASEIRQRSMGIAEMTDDELSKLVSDAKALAMTIPKSASPSLPMSITRALAEGFLQAQRPLEASRMYHEFADSLGPVHGNWLSQKLHELADQAEENAKRVGKPVELHGTLMDGNALNWQAYRGKVVLINFWASWSATHRTELAQMQELYHAYRGRGFEIIGVCLDKEREPAEAFIELNEVSWANLFSTNSGWEHPVAKLFDVKSVPTAIMIDREGKILSTSARGTSLAHLLTQRFDSPSSNHHGGSPNNHESLEFQGLSAETADSSEHGNDEP